MEIQRFTKMKVNEIFYSLQGEGAHTGTPAIFIRFASCNLRCPFCDTNFDKYNELSKSAILDAIKEYPAQLVVLTGGEPTLQDLAPLIDDLHKAGKFVAIETNGTNETPSNADWVTCSPKVAFVKNAPLKLTQADEVKVVFDGQSKVEDYGIEARHYYLQPCDTGNAEQNERIINDCINYIKQHPKWKLSLQTQKILKVR